jgi:hypothetical protein
MYPGKRMLDITHGLLPGSHLSVMKVRQSSCNIDSQGHTMAWLVAICAVPALQRKNIEDLFADHHTSVFLGVSSIVFVAVSYSLL